MSTEKKIKFKEKTSGWGVLFTVLGVLLLLLFLTGAIIFFFVSWLPWHTPKTCCGFTTLSFLVLSIIFFVLGRLKKTRRVYDEAEASASKDVVEPLLLPEAEEEKERKDRSVTQREKEKSPHSGMKESKQGKPGSTADIDKESKSNASESKRAEGGGRKKNGSDKQGPADIKDSSFSTMGDIHAEWTFPKSEHRSHGGMGEKKKEFERLFKRDVVVDGEIVNEDDKEKER